MKKYLLCASIIFINTLPAEGSGPCVQPRGVKGVCTGEHRRELLAETGISAKCNVSASAENGCELCETPDSAESDNLNKCKELSRTNPNIKNACWASAGKHIHCRSVH